MPNLPNLNQFSIRQRKKKSLVFVTPSKIDLVGNAGASSALVQRI